MDEVLTRIEQRRGGRIRLSHALTDLAGERDRS